MNHTIVFAAGCFWGVEKYFSNLVGVIETTACYTAGEYDNPTYETVLQYRDDDSVVNYTEAVSVVYDDDIISTTELLKHFWQVHNPTQGNRQGADVGNNYRSGIYYTNDEQKEVAFSTKLEYQSILTSNGFDAITTEIKELRNTYEAEKYHQQYLAKNPNGYCPNHSVGVEFDDFSKKEIFITGDATQFKQEIAQNYGGAIPISYIHEDSEYRMILTHNNQKVFAHTEPLSSQEFYVLLGAFVFGKESEEFKVGFGGGTDNRFCKKYDLFKTTTDGYFADKLSGEKLFSTDVRFDSGSGWLSFTEAVEGSVIEKTDASFGMERVEVLASISGMHLGHVFDGERGAGSRRYCINASILDFVES